jgi:hypothetical protein
MAESNGVLAASLYYFGRRLMREFVFVLAAAGPALVMPISLASASNLTGDAKRQGGHTKLHRHPSRRLPRMGTLLPPWLRHSVRPLAMLVPALLLTAHMRLLAVAASVNKSWSADHVCRIDQTMPCTIIQISRTIVQGIPVHVASMAPGSQSECSYISKQTIAD